MGVKKYVTIPTVIILASLFSYFASHQSRNVQGYSLFSILVVLAHLIQTIAFIPAFIFNTELFYDLTGSLTYITLILTAIFTNSDTLTVRQIIASFLVLLWAVRLGSFLFMRILKVGEDSRFISIKKSTLGFFHAWFIQGLWVSVTISPLLIIVVSDSKDQNISLPLSWIDILALLVWLIGFLIEIIADQQKNNFKFNKNNHDKFITNGLWKYSRHPNYVGQIILWFAASIFSFPSLKSSSHVVLICPFFVYMLLTKLSGVPLLEKKADLKWGKLQQYINYKSQTPVLFPWGSSKQRENNVKSS